MWESNTPWFSESRVTAHCANWPSIRKRVCNKYNCITIEYIISYHLVELHCLEQTLDDLEFSTTTLQETDSELEPGILVIKVKDANHSTNRAVKYDISSCKASEVSVSKFVGVMYGRRDPSPCLSFPLQNPQT
ncbi:jg17656 [Pararge aegeria aegeria]|uniref:Jg17656 protein n=1 Tax=Pararge aegeria aegeria TaxID=348720 RepID=A0A8S4RFS6_9NEOP|nr:jg17656 [Pararge aegeria aegeria]